MIKFEYYGCSTATEFKMILNGLERHYHLIRTNAPMRYDYGYCITLSKDSGERMVLIPVDKVEYQTARYKSGIYQFEPCDSVDADSIAEYILTTLAEVHEG